MPWDVAALLEEFRCAVLDARLLAYHSLTGLSPSSYIVPDDLQVLRVLLGVREYAQRQATTCDNLIVKYLLRFGHTFGSTAKVSNPLRRGIFEGVANLLKPFQEPL
ncbi:MAG: hypothetical protein ACP5VE_13615 [Chthonomonadales bacterium]